jgi:mutator protein MutT
VSAPARIQVAAGLVFRAGKLLITQRPAASHLGGLWEFPGGKREPNETFEECLHRELKEELGIEVDVKELVETVTHDYPEKCVTLNFYRCAWKANEPRALGCPDFRWIAPAELSHYKFPEADVKLVEMLAHRTELWL